MTIGNSPHDNASEYQDVLEVCHPSQEEYPKKVNEFLDKLKKLSVESIRFGFAYSDQEGTHNLRHLSASLADNGYSCPGDGSFPLENSQEFPDIRMGGIGNYLDKLFDDVDDYCEGESHMWVLDVKRRRLVHEGELYITTPELQNMDGDEEDWNYYD